MKEYTIRYQSFDSDTLLPQEDQKLLQAAKDAALLAYAPYSRFRVGAAARLSDGSIHTGNNQENAAYPSGMCAERVLLYALGAQGLIPKIESIAVRAVPFDREYPVPVCPCGACRQVIQEYELLSAKTWEVFLQGSSGIVLKFIGAGKSLLPFSFDLTLK